MIKKTKNNKKVELNATKLIFSVLGTYINFPLLVLINPNIVMRILLIRCISKRKSFSGNKD